MHISSFLLASVPVVHGFVIPQQFLEESSPFQSVISSSADKTELELVSSERLQGDILAGNLFRRAKQLYEIAKLGAEEFDHPTRVIGSKGKFAVGDSPLPYGEC